MNKAAFYAALRKSKVLFGTSMSQSQVDVLNAILDQCKGMTAPHVAYIMATGYHETGAPRMVPSVENLHYTSAERIMAGRYFSGNPSGTRISISICSTLPVARSA